MERVMTQNSWQRIDSIKFLRKLFLRKILLSVLHDALDFEDTSALYKCVLPVTHNHFMEVIPH